MVGELSPIPSLHLLRFYVINVVLTCDKFIAPAQHLLTFPDTRIKHIQSICMEKKFACI